MKLVVGGFYQGKREFARKNFSLTDSQILCLDRGKSFEQLKTLDEGIKAIFNLDALVEDALKSNENPQDILQQINLDEKIIIATDISQGVVPISKEDRERRELNGRVLIDLASEAKEVYRVFCGIGQRIK